MKRGCILILSMLLTACGGGPELPQRDGLQREASELLYDWLGALIAQQQSSPDPAMDGGFFCPACQRVHGRCADAILPLMYACRETGDRKYLDAAVRLWEWMERNTSMPDGSWVNDVQISDWKGTTVFSVIAVGEALMRYGDLLPPETAAAWWARLERAAEYIYGNDADFSRRCQGDRNQNVNYSASAPYALWIVGQKTGRTDFLNKAAQIAADLFACFSPNDRLLYGEAPKMGPTPKGSYPVDLGYNVEESLPNLAFYAAAAGNDALSELVGCSMRSHLEFMLPDGAWDNSWGTRSFKWTYWGSRTSDGMAAGYALFMDEYPEFRTAVRRNLELLRRATYGGMLYGGMHYRSAGQPPCNHHTFSHARGLASLLAVYEPASADAVPLPLPREAVEGVREFRDIRTWLAAAGAWRATITDLDAPYRVTGTHPMGGALSLLWHRTLGPVFAAGMNRYALIEPTNMQMDRQTVTTSPSPRIEYTLDGILYTNIDDPFAKVAFREGCFESLGALVDVDGNAPPQGPVRVATEYRLTEEGFVMRVELLSSVAGAVRVVLPFIARSDEACGMDGARFHLQRGGLTLRCEADAPLRVGGGNTSGRIFCFTPGFEVVPVVAPLTAGKSLEIRITVSDKML